jgi:hypothetical protein
MFRNKYIFYGEGLLAPRPTSKLAAYSVYSQLTSNAGSRPSIRDPRTRHAVVTGAHLTWAHRILPGTMESRTDDPF